MTRQPSLDVFRGLTVAAMLLVNNPGRWGEATQYAQLRHADWNGVTLTDLVFPFFLFAVGVSLVFSSTRRHQAPEEAPGFWRHVYRRSAVLIGLGLLQNRFSILLAGGLFDLHALWVARVPGVLFRIGLCYLLATLLHEHLRRSRRLLWVLALLLVSYGVTLSYLPVPGYGTPDLDLPLRDASGVYHAEFSNLCAWIDTRVFGVRCLHHLRDPETGRLLWAFDPEGLLSTLGALATTLLGVLAGRRWRGEMACGPPPDRQAPPAELALRRVVELRAWWSMGAVLLAAGWLGAEWIPWNKRLWTPSYVLWTGGIALITLSALRVLVDAGVWRRGYEPFEWYGRNAITAFFYSSLAATLSIRLSIPFGPEQGTPLKRWLYEHLFASWADPRPASLLYALGVVIVWALVCGEMHRRRYYWKI